MIIDAKIISEPCSGEYDEIIYDVQPTSFKSSYWGWIKFIDDDYNEWCGEFRGIILDVEISLRFNTVLILTTDCLFLLDRISHKLLDMCEEPEYDQLTLSPSQEYILASSYEIVVIKDSLKQPLDIELPIGTCSIKILEWQEHNLLLEFQDYIETGYYFNATLNSNTYEVTSISQQ